MSDSEETKKPEKPKQKLSVTPLNKSFGERLKELRMREGLQQEDLAKKLGVHVQTISRYERGLIDPVLSKLVDIAKKCSVSIDWLASLSDTANLNCLQIPYLDEPYRYWTVDRAFLSSLTNKEIAYVFIVKNNNLQPAIQKGDIVLISEDQNPAVDKYVIFPSGSGYAIKKVTAVLRGSFIQLHAYDNMLRIPDEIIGTIEAYCRNI
jgi:transcriptional regulator with XRE-family HTH domain